MFMQVAGLFLCIFHLPIARRLAGCNAGTTTNHQPKGHTMATTTTQPTYKGTKGTYGVYVGGVLAGTVTAVYAGSKLCYWRAVSTNGTRGQGTTRTAAVGNMLAAQAAPTTHTATPAARMPQAQRTPLAPAYTSTPHAPTTQPTGSHSYAAVVAQPTCVRCHQAPATTTPGSALCGPCATAVLAAPPTLPPATSTHTAATAHATRGTLPRCMCLHCTGCTACGLLAGTGGTCKATCTPGAVCPVCGAATACTVCGQCYGCGLCAYCRPCTGCATCHAGNGASCTRCYRAHHKGTHPTGHRMPTAMAGSN